MKTVQPRKQRKMLYQAPLHSRHQRFSAPLSPSLKSAHKVNSFPIRSGDTVRVMRGDRKGSEGKVTKVDSRKYRIFIEGITREKVDGSAIQAAIHPSKVMLTNLNLDDKWRRESLKVEVAKEAEKPEETTVEPPKVRKKRKPRKAPTEKAKAPSKRRVKKTTEEKKGEAEIG